MDIVSTASQVVVDPVPLLVNHTHNGSIQILAVSICTHHCSKIYSTSFSNNCQICAMVCVGSIAPGTRSLGHNTENSFSLYFHSYPRLKFGVIMRCYHCFIYWLLSLLLNDGFQVPVMEFVVKLLLSLCNLTLLVWVGWIFWKNQVSTRDADALAPCVVKTSAIILLTLQQKHIFVFHGERFHLPVPSSCDIWVLKNDRKYKYIYVYYKLSTARVNSLWPSDLLK